MAAEAPPTVLLVDDDHFVRALLRDALGTVAQELRLVEAADGEEAVAVAEQERPALVFLDLFMPRMSGLDVLARLRERVPEARVVVVSSMDAEPVIEQALAAGAVGFVGKPFHPLEIVAAVRKVLGGRE